MGMRFLFGLALAVCAMACTSDAERAIEPTSTSAPNSAVGKSPGSSTSLVAELSEWQLKLPGTAALAGTIQLSVRNLGAQRHELRVLKVGAGETALQTNGERVDESKYELVASLPPLDAGREGRVELVAGPGSYVLLCNLPGHYERGVRTPLQLR